MLVPTIFAALLSASTASAHAALWDRGMFGFNYPYKSDDPQNNNYNNNQPVNPLRQIDGFTTAEWFGHGLLDYPPKAGDFMILPSGGTYNGEVSCNRGQTTLGNPADKSPKYKYACKPDGGQYSGVGALHVMNTYDQPPNNALFGGSSLAIAYTSDVGSLKPNDMTVISVNQNSVWEREISYSIPAGMPPCPAGGCLCSWNWIHQGGKGEGYPYEIYNVIYRCQVTGATNTAKKVQKGAIPNKCDQDKSKCVQGPKTPMYLYQADGNNLPDLDSPPLYNNDWGFVDGAQNDIFTPAATPAGSSPPKASTTALPSGWSAVGCMVDSTTSRTLSGPSSSSSNNTIESCVASCAAKGYNFAGVEFGQECYCSNAATLTPAPDAECSSVCAGDVWAYCGGSSRINVFRSSKAPASGQPVPLPAASLPAGWSDVGCIVDNESNRVMNGGSSQSSTNTVQSCIASCSSKGFAYAGVEYGVECWCSSSATKFVTASSGCNVACGGDPAHVCGGSSRLNVYSSKPSTSSVSASSSKSTAASSSAVKSSAASSLVKSTTSSVVKATSTSSQAATSASVSKSATPASSSKATLTSSTSKAASSTSTSKAVVTSTAKTSTTTATPSSSSSTATLSSTSTSRAASATPAAIAPGISVPDLPAGWKNLGCFVDSSSARVLKGFSVGKPNMTFEYCIDICTRRNFSYAGVENGDQCYCDTKPIALTTATGCDRPCTGDSKQLCGGYDRITIFEQAAKKARRGPQRLRAEPPY